MELGGTIMMGELRFERRFPSDYEVVFCNNNFNCELVVLSSYTTGPRGRVLPDTRDHDGCGICSTPYIAYLYELMQALLAVHVPLYTFDLKL